MRESVLQYLSTEDYNIIVPRNAHENMVRFSAGGGAAHEQPTTSFPPLMNTIITVTAHDTGYCMDM